MKCFLFAIIGFICLEISSCDIDAPSMITAFGKNKDILKSNANDDTLIFAHVVSLARYYVNKSSTWSWHKSLHTIPKRIDSLSLWFRSRIFFIDFRSSEFEIFRIFGIFSALNNKFQSILYRSIDTEIVTLPTRIQMILITMKQIGQGALAN